MQVVIIFNAAPPPSGQSFQLLRVKLTDAGSTDHIVDLLSAQITAGAVQQPDGTYQISVNFTNLAIGPYVVDAQCLDQNGNPLGPVATSSGNVSLADGVWYPSPVSIA